MGLEGLDAALTLDANDSLASFRDLFYLPEDAIYLDGNSLGLLSRPAEQALQALLASWKQYGIDGWMGGQHPWFYLAERLGDAMAGLVGAHPDEVIATGSTTSNLHQLISTFYQPTGQRYKIVADELTFPSDIYALQSQVRLHGFSPEDALIRVASRDGATLSEADLIAAMDDSVALVVLPSVLYRSGQLLDVERLTRAAQERRIPIGFDLCHSIGAVPHQLNAWGVDFAVWCTYKYLNGGPGSVAGLYVNRRHFERDPALTGWFGSDKRVQFDMAHAFTKAADAGSYQLGTPHVLSLAPLIGSLEMFQTAGMEAIRSKSLQLTDYLMARVDAELADFGFRIGNPRESHRRGGHVSLVHPEAVRICKALKKAGVIVDYRAPDVVRLAPIALYTSFADVHEAVGRLRGIMESRAYEQFEKQREVIA